MSSPFEIEYGGPDQPVGHLSGVLLRRVQDTPPGGSIDWVTYYFRDCRIAGALIEARNRGARVSLTIAGSPRTSDANAEAMELLSGSGGLGDSLRVVTIPGIALPGGRSWRPQIHEKLYCFSHPDPVAYIGSFNPSSNDRETRPDIIREIGDHDYSSNVLIGIRDEPVVKELVRHARELHAHPPGLLYRFSRRASVDIARGSTRVCFWPRLSPHPVLRSLDALGKGAFVRIAASHIRSSRGVRCIAGLARRGAKVQLLADSTLRRVTRSAEKRLVSSGVDFKRCYFEDNVSMHLKLVLAESGNKRWSAGGSFNWTNPSFFLNHEIALISDDPGLFESLDNCWQALSAAAADKQGCR